MTQDEQRPSDEQVAENGEAVGEATPAEEAVQTVAEEGGSEPPVSDEAVEEAATETPDPVSEEPPEAPPKRKKKRLPRPLRRRRTRTTREKPEGRKPIVRLPKPESERGRRQERRGVVVSSGMDKTIVVKVDTVKAHPRYKKVVRRSRKLHAHDESNVAKVGDVVRIVETRPLSKLKNWRLAEVLEEAR